MSTVMNMMGFHPWSRVGEERSGEPELPYFMSNRHAEMEEPPPARRLHECHAVLLMAPGPERDGLATGLWDAGMLVTTFQSPHEAEGVLIGEPVQVILVDGALGPQLAAQVVWWLNAVGRGAVKVVAFGDFSAEAHRQLLGAGVSFCVPRPGDPRVFARQLGAAVGFGPPPLR